MDDLISREDAIKALGERPEVFRSNDDPELYAKCMGARDQYDNDLISIKSVPSAEPRKIFTIPTPHEYHNGCGECRGCKHDGGGYCELWSAIEDVILEVKLCNEREVNHGKNQN